MGTGYPLLVTSAFGIESVVAGELRHLGYQDCRTSDGRISLAGAAADIARLNLFLRAADRVLLELGRFPAPDFDRVFAAVRDLQWDGILPEDAKIDVLVSLHRKSTITSARACQGVVKRAIIERLRRRYPETERFPESGAVWTIHCLFDGDEATIALDTSGPGLHKRGYRLAGGEAPLRETTAAALPMLCKWFGRGPLWDPFCGSGTIVIEAALLAAGLPPGARRSFAGEGWAFLDRDAWSGTRASLPPVPANLPEGCEIVGSDIDPAMVELARENARRAGVDHLVRFYRADALTHEPRPGPGLILTNPPWGERLGDPANAEAILADFGKTSARFAGWGCAVLTTHGSLEKAFGRRFSSNRKLYNGNIQCRLYRFEAPYAPNRR